MCGKARPRWSCSPCGGWRHLPCGSFFLLLSAAHLLLGLVLLFAWLTWPMTCLPDRNRRQALGADFVSAYCYGAGTFNRLPLLDDQETHHELPLPSEAEHRIVEYNFVGYAKYAFLAVAAILLLPAIVWRLSQGQKIVNVTKGNDGKAMVARASTLLRTQKIRLVHWTFLFCASLNLLIAIVSFVALDALFGGAFAKLGFDLIGEGFEALFARQFPARTNCDFYLFGPSGAREVASSICAVPEHGIIGACASISWLLLVAAMTVGSVTVLKQLLVTFSAKIRSFLLKRSIPSMGAAAATFCREASLSQWTCLMLVAKGDKVFEYETMELMQQLREQVGDANEEELKL